MWWGMLFAGTSEARVHVVGPEDPSGVLDLRRRDVCYVVPLDDPELDLGAFLVQTPSGDVPLDDLMLAIDPRFPEKRSRRRSTPTFYTIQFDPDHLAYQDGDGVDLSSTWSEIRRLLTDR